MAGTLDPTSDPGATAPAERLFFETLGRVLSGLIHEVNNPLGVVLGFAQELASAPAPPATWPDDLATIVQESKRIAALLTTWRLVLKRDGTGLTDDLRLSGARVWHVVSYFARGRYEISGLPEEAAPSEGSPWAVEWPADTQVLVWMLVFRWLLEQMPANHSADVAVDFADSHLKLVAVSLADFATTETAAARECRQILADLLAPLQATVTVAGNEFAIRVR